MIPRGVYGALGLGAVKHENDAVTQTSQILQKYPQIQQTLQQVGPQAVQMAGSLRRQLEQLERDKKPQPPLSPCRTALNT